jgi:hypothetical protein
MQERRAGERGLDLSALATVDLYRHNAFRLSGLPVDASLRQIRRKTGEIEAAERLGDDGLIKSDQLFPVKPSPSAETISTALQRLRDPNRRLLDEWFWLWPIPGVELDGAKPADAGRAWGERVGAGTAEASIALHNIAVTAHLNVLESGNGSKSVETIWRGVYRRWRKVIDDERCWEWLEQRVAAIADPQLKTGAVAELRRELPSLLLEIHAGLAASAVAWPTRVKLHVKAMRDSGFGREPVDRALLGAVQGQVTRLRALADRARDAVQAREPWEEVVGSITEESAADRKTLDLLVGLDHPVVAGVTDRLAGSLRECVIASVNRSGADGLNQPEDYAHAVQGLDKARAIARDGHAWQQIKADMVTLLTNQVVVTCNAALENAQRTRTYTLDAERRLVKETSAPMQRLRKLDRAAHDSLCDEVAGTSFVMLIEYVNHHGLRGADVSGALPGLRKALELATGSELVGRIRKAINDIERIAGPARPAPSTLGYGTATSRDDRADEYLRLLGLDRRDDSDAFRGAFGGAEFGGRRSGLDFGRTVEDGICALCGSGYGYYDRRFVLTRTRPFDGRSELCTVEVSCCEGCRTKRIAQGPLRFGIRLLVGAALATFVLMGFVWSSAVLAMILVGFGFGIVIGLMQWAVEHRVERHKRLASHSEIAHLLRTNWRIR